MASNKCDFWTNLLTKASFGDDEPDKLEDYALFVRLPGWLPETED